MLISGILAGFRLEKFRFSIFKISRKLVFLGRVSKFLEGCRALHRDPALPVAEAMAEAPGPCSAKEAAAGPPGRGARGPGWCASVPMLSAGATWERLSPASFKDASLCPRHLPFTAALGRWATVSVVCGKPQACRLPALVAPASHRRQAPSALPRDLRCETLGSLMKSRGWPSAHAAALAQSWGGGGPS